MRRRRGAERRSFPSSRSPSRRKPQQRDPNSLLPIYGSVSIEEIGNTAVYLLSDLGSAVTGEIHFVDAGYSIISMPHPDALRADATLGEVCDALRDVWGEYRPGNI